MLYPHSIYKQAMNTWTQLFLSIFSYLILTSTGLLIFSVQIKISLDWYASALRPLFQSKIVTKIWSHWSISIVNLILFFILKPLKPTLAINYSKKKTYLQKPTHYFFPLGPLNIQKSVIILFQNHTMLQLQMWLPDLTIKKC